MKTKMNVQDCIGNFKNKMNQISRWKRAALLFCNIDYLRLDGKYMGKYLKFLYIRKYDNSFITTTTTTTVIIIIMLNVWFHYII